VALTPAFGAGIPPLLVVHFLQKLTDRGAGVLQITVFATVDFLILEGLEERLAGSVIPGVALSPRKLWSDIKRGLLKPLRIGGQDSHRGTRTSSLSRADAGTGH
jgi:hypothetical protein